MIRTFKTHRIRNQVELTGNLWEFEACSGDHKGEKYLMHTPSCWENHPDFSDYRGEGIYRKLVTAGGNLRLECKGISHTATVYFDGVEIINHYNAYTAFSVLIPNVEHGEHLIEIKVDNRFGETSALHFPNDYMSYGGISRGVILEELQDAYIQYVHVTPYFDGENWNGRIECGVSFLGQQEDDAFEIEIKIANQIVRKELNYSDKKEIVIKEDMSFTDIATWDVENPKLYEVETKLMRNCAEIDDLIDRFGFREVKVEGKHILLNNRKIRIKGVCRHEDHPQYGCALPYHAIAYDLMQIHHMGANAIRTSHYPNDEIFLDLCDELGILVWEENHARGIEEEQMKNPYFKEQAENVIKEMIPQHYNHPSIFIWGILNECASEAMYGRECYKAQFDLIKSLDSTRPYTFASCKFFRDICFDLPDVISCNVYPRWYVDKTVEEYLSEIKEWIKDDGKGDKKPFVISEIGAGGIYGYRNEYEGKWTEEYQAKALKEQVETCLSFEDCCGVFIWQFCDIRVSEEWFASRPRGMNNKGLVDEFRRKKLGYFVVRDIFCGVGNYFEDVLN